MKELVSVVIPMYNSEEYIYETVMSVMKQSYKAFEVIIIDDGSTDKSSQIVKNMIIWYRIMRPRYKKRLTTEI